MVYCTRCGTLNADDAAVCKNCGASIQFASQYNYEPYYYHHRHHYHEEYGHRHSGLGAMLVGIVIILFGSSLLFSQVYGVPINWAAWWAIIIIVIGVWLLAVAYRRTRRYSRRSPPPP
jgi:uncharacterized membrane protein YvbJ